MGYFRLTLFQTYHKHMNHWGIKQNRNGWDILISLHLGGLVDFQFWRDLELRIKNQFLSWNHNN